MDTYVRSCAGYCVITYLLGVGDRHLDNLLLTKDGKLFHIDFGYILGRDPKPLPPPMKLSKEMVEGMGGINSEHYQQFRKLCYTAFLHLRRYVHFFLIECFPIIVNSLYLKKLLLFTIALFYRNVEIKNINIYNRSTIAIGKLSLNFRY